MFYIFVTEWAQQAPGLFSAFIPQINPPAVESLLSDYAAYDQKLQMELSMNGFPRSVLTIHKSHYFNTTLVCTEVYLKLLISLFQR